MLNNKEADGVVESSADSIQINVSQMGQKIYSYKPKSR